MIDDNTLFYVGIFVITLLILAFIFTAFEFKNLDESNEKHYRHDDNTDVNFKE